MFRQSIACLPVCLALMAASAHAGVIYATGFESPTFSLGQVNGQDGWAAFGSPGAGTVQNTVAASGTQALRVDGSVGSQSGPYYTTTTAATSLLVSADLLISSASTQSSWQFAGLGAGLIGFAGGIDISGTSIQSITAGYPVIGTLQRDVWNHIDLYFDFDLQQTTIVLNGSTLAAGVAFCGDNGPCTGAPVTSLRTVIFDSFGGGQDAGYLDNFSISTVPEPGTLALVCAALMVATHARRGRAGQAARRDA
jgi:hypothetical protein